MGWVAERVRRGLGRRGARARAHAPLVVRLRLTTRDAPSPSHAAAAILSNPFGFDDADFPQSDYFKSMMGACQAQLE